MLGLWKWVTVPSVTAPTFVIHTPVLMSPTYTSATTSLSSPPTNPWSSLTNNPADWPLLDQLTAWNDPAQMMWQPPTLARVERRQLNNEGWRDQIYTPAIQTHQEAARRDEAAYLRALAECNSQEAARVLRLIEAHEQTVEAQRQAWEAQQQRVRDEQAIRSAAEERATQLLLEHLTPEQRKTFTENGWFMVEGGNSKTRYRINTRSAAGNIDVLSSDLFGRGKVTHRLCCHVPFHHNLPLSDHLLSQKIMLELAEDDFLRTANRTAA